MKALPVKAIALGVAGVAVLGGAIAALSFGLGGGGEDATQVKADPSGVFVVKRNGGWCWFQDERVIVDGDKVLVGTVAGTTRDGTSAGDIEVTTFDLKEKTSKSVVLHPELQSDDHASPSLVRLADGRYLSAYTTHGKDAVMRWRVTSAPGDAGAWEPEKTLRLKGKGITYSNLALEPGGEGRLWNFFRQGDNLPGTLVMKKDGAFEQVAPLLSWSRKSPTWDEKKSTRPSEAKPYLRYAMRGGKVHFITTEDHPRAYDNSVYHGVIEGHVLKDSMGTVLDEDIREGEPVELTKLTRVWEGNRNAVAWLSDIDVDAEGKPFVVFYAQKDGQGRMSKKDIGGKEHSLHFARFDGKAWAAHEIGHAGSFLYKHEVNYTGLAALVSKKPDVMFLSADVDPATGKPLAERRRFEMFRGATADGGKTWTWKQLTRGSRVDHFRPVVPEWDGGTLVLWLRGDYHSMGRYDLDVVGMMDPGPEGTPS